MNDPHIRDFVVEHPWQAIGFAALIGAAFGALAAPRGKIGELLGATVGAFAMRLLRDLAIREVTASAKRWREHAS